MNADKLAYALGVAYTEFQIELTHNPPIEGDCVVGGNVRVTEVATGEIAKDVWREDVRMPSGLPRKLLKLIEARFPESRTAKAYQDAWGLDLVWWNPQFNLEDVGFGYCAHLALRKLCDDPITSILYRELSHISGTPLFGVFSNALSKAFSEIQKKGSVSSHYLATTVRDRVQLSFEVLTGALKDSDSKQNKQAILDGCGQIELDPEQLRQFVKKYKITKDVFTLEDLTDRTTRIELLLRSMSNEQILCMCGFLISYDQPSQNSTEI